MSLRFKLVSPRENVATQFCILMGGVSRLDGWSSDMSYLLFPIVRVLINCDTP